MVNFRCIIVNFAASITVGIPKDDGREAEYSEMLLHLPPMLLYTHGDPADSKPAKKLKVKGELPYSSSRRRRIAASNLVHNSVRALPMFR